jgi:hypothetical protein
LLRVPTKNKGGRKLDRPKVLVELYKGLLNRIIATADVEAYVLTEDSKDLEKWDLVIIVRNDEEFRHLAKKIINKEI